MQFLILRISRQPDARRALARIIIRQRLMHLMDLGQRAVILTRVFQQLSKLALTALNLRQGTIQIGRHLGKDVEDVPRQIVGIVGDLREAGLAPEAALYVPAMQVPDGLNARNNGLLPVTWVVRTAGTASAGIR